MIDRTFSRVSIVLKVSKETLVVPRILLTARFSYINFAAFYCKAYLYTSILPLGRTPDTQQDGIGPDLDSSTLLVPGSETNYIINGKVRLVPK